MSESECSAGYRDAAAFKNSPLGGLWSDMPACLLAWHQLQLKVEFSGGYIRGS